MYELLTELLLNSSTITSIFISVLFCGNIIFSGANLVFFFYCNLKFATKETVEILKVEFKAVEKSQIETATLLKSIHEAVGTLGKDLNAANQKIFDIVKSS